MNKRIILLIIAYFLGIAAFGIHTASALAVLWGAIIFWDDIFDNKK